jgi:opacity protein-like surface antigen
MQKKIMAFFMMSVLCLPGLSYADSSYVKFGMGQSRYSGDDSSNATGYFFAYGMQIDPSMDVEFGVIDFGRARLETRNGADLFGIVRSRTRSVYAAAIGNIPMSPTVSFQGKLGLAIHRSSAQEVSDSIANLGFTAEGAGRKVGGVIGAGLKMQLSKEIAGAVEYTYFGSESHGAKLSLFNAALMYNF